MYLPSNLLAYLPIPCSSLFIYVMLLFAYFTGRKRGGGFFSIKSDVYFFSSVSIIVSHSAVHPSLNCTEYKLCLFHWTGKHFAKHILQWGRRTASSSCQSDVVRGFIDCASGAVKLNLHPKRSWKAVTTDPRQRIKPAPRSAIS